MKVVRISASEETTETEGLGCCTIAGGGFEKMLESDDIVSMLGRGRVKKHSHSKVRLGRSVSLVIFGVEPGRVKEGVR